MKNTKDKKGVGFRIPRDIEGYIKVATKLEDEEQTFSEFIDKQLNEFIDNHSIDDILLASKRLSNEKRVIYQTYIMKETKEKLIDIAEKSNLNISIILEKAVFDKIKCLNSKHLESINYVKKS